jgi:hypothetical protein
MFVTSDGQVWPSGKRRKVKSRLSPKQVRRAGVELVTLGLHRENLLADPPGYKPF